MDPNKYDPAMKSFALRLFEINAFRFGDFKMKVGINSPVYFDLRVIMSFPDMMNSARELLTNYMKNHHLKPQHVCGVPYTALPLATMVSVVNGLPMLIRRKEAKAYGTKKLIEGRFNAGDTCVIIEDVITTGSSVLETVNDLKAEGIVVTDVIVMVDREQGGVRNIAQHSINVHPLFKLSDLLEILCEAEKVDRATVDSVAKYIAAVQLDEVGNMMGNVKDKPVCNELVRWRMPFEKRAEMAKCEMAKKLFQLMAKKKTNLCLAVDVTTCFRVLEMADKCGPFICLLKTHVDSLSDFSETFVKSLLHLAKKHNFLIMEDRKFADIGHTVFNQCHRGMFHISNWADLVTVHAIPGRGILQGLKKKESTTTTTTTTTNKEEEEETKTNKQKLGGVFIVAEMSSHGNLIDHHYRDLASKMATSDTDVDFVAGLVCQSRDCFAFPGLIQLTPGIKLQNEEGDSGDHLGQQYNSPVEVVQKNAADVCVVGRGILEAKCPEATAALYRDKLWAAYLERLAL